MAFDIKGMLTGVLLPLLLDAGEKALDEVLDDFATSEPEWHKTVVIVAHRLLKVHGAEVVAKTDNTYDDKAVEAAIHELETNATKHGISLAA